MSFKALLLKMGISTMVLSSLLSFNVALADDKATHDVKRSGVVTSKAGVEVGEKIIFKGVGVFYYAGWAGGDVYLAEMDEVGGYEYKEAEERCRGKGAGWSVPTIDQLDLLRIHKDKVSAEEMGIKGVSGSWYWSSTRYDQDRVWTQRFSDSIQQPIKDTFVARLRCVKVY